MTIALPQSSYEILSPRLVLRTAVPSDAEALYKFWSNPLNWPYDEVEKDLTVEKMSTRIGKWTESTLAGKNAFMVIALRNTGELMGFGGFNMFEHAPWHTPDKPPASEEGQAASEHTEGPYLTDIGIMVDHKLWHQGYGREALCASIECAFREFGCDEVRVETATANEPCRALMRSVGLGGTEKHQRLSYGPDENIGWRWVCGSAAWNVAKEGMMSKGKWPL